MANPAPLFPKNTSRFEPYKNFKFRVYFGDMCVAGISKVSSLKQSTETVTHREGGDNSVQHICPTMSKFEPITLERGVSWNHEFMEWATEVAKVNAPGIENLSGFRRNIQIMLLNEAGDPTKVYNAYECWVSEYEMLPELDGNSGSIAIERIVVQTEGIEIDPGYTEQKEG